MTANHEGSWRGMFVHKNVFGAFCALAAVLFYAEWVYRRFYKMPMASALLCGIALALTIASKSSTALVMLVVGFGCFYAFNLIIAAKRKDKRVALFLALLFTAFVAYLSLMAMLDIVLGWLGKDATLTGRTELWQVLFQLALERPALGWGLGLFHRPEIMYQYSVQFGWMAKSTHSSFIDLVLGVGLPAALLLMLWGVGQLIRMMLKCSSNVIMPICYSGAMSLIVLLLLVAASSSGVFLSPSFFWLLLLSCGLVVGKQPVQQQVVATITLPSHLARPVKMASH
ncbi:hypothetical protein GCM10011369_02340 [Neiella marina]|uniref:O-antigen ligase-related domain-containing protein n=2 Tax=Neiella marina TaxID=508461 RepID=A0A8J2XKV6_9GAMM|nr:hypothetical protein GCM10011369_02340 [Neiella marina]